MEKPFRVTIECLDPTLLEEGALPIEVYECIGYDAILNMETETILDAHGEHNHAGLAQSIADILAEQPETEILLLAIMLEKMGQEKAVRGRPLQ